MQGLLILAALIGGWWVMARWGKKYGWGSTKRHLLGGVFGACVAAIVGIFVLVNAISKVPATPEVASSPSVESQESEVMKPEPVKPAEPSLGITLDEFISNFNGEVASVPSHPQLKDPVITDGPERSVAKFNVDDNRILLVGINNGTRDVRSVTFLAANDGTVLTAANVLVTSSMAVISAFEEEEARQKARKAFGELMKEVKPNGDTVRRMIDGKKVWLSLSDVTGFTGGVELENNNAE